VIEGMKGSVGLSEKVKEQERRRSLLDESLQERKKEWLVLMSSNPEEEGVETMKSPATKRMLLSRLPKLLTFHLCRRVSRHLHGGGSSSSSSSRRRRRTRSNSNL